MKGLGFLLIFIVQGLFSYSQSVEALRDLEKSIKPYVDLVFDAPTDNERFNANEKLLDALSEVLSMPKSFAYPFNELNRLSILKSSDNRFRIITWSVIDQEGFFENYGFIQSRNLNKDEYELYRLFDKSDEIFNPELAKCDNENWYGAVYYELITRENEGRKYYTLLGYNGNNIYTKKKIIEPISFRGNNSKPEFGLSIFFKEKDRKRFIYEYNPETSFVLKWDNQYYENPNPKTSFSVKNIFASNKPKPISNEKNQPPDPRTVALEEMIVFEVLEPLYEGMEGLYQFYVGSGVMNGFKFERGRWRLVENILPRNAQPKKEEEPKRKRTGSEQPMYDTNNRFKKIN